MDTELHVVAIRLAGQGLELSDAADAPTSQRLRFFLSRAKARTALRELDAAEGDLELAERLAAASGDALLVARVQVGRGDLAQKRGQLGPSEELLSSAIATFREVGDERCLADALLTMGITKLFAGDDVAAEACFVEARGVFERLGDQRGQAWALQNLAWAAYGSGRIDEADARCLESAEIFRALGDEGGLGWALGMLAYVRYHQGRWEEAEALCDGTLSEAGVRGDPWAMGMMLCLRALLRLWTGRAASALEPAQRATQQFRRIDDWWGLLMSLGALSRTLVSLGRVDEGLAVADEAVGVAASVSYPSADAIAAMNVAAAAAQAGRPDRAAGAGCLPVDDEATPPHLAVSDHFVAQGMLLLQKGDAAAARRHLDEAVANGNGDAGGYLLSALALARLADGDVEGAQSACDAVEDLEGPTYVDRSVARVARALAAARVGDEPGAKAALESAYEVVAGTDDRTAQAVVATAAWQVQRLRGSDVDNEPGGAAASAGPGWRVALALAAGA